MTNPRKSETSSLELDTRVGLCSACRHARRVEGVRGSLFWLCERSLTDATFRRYPRLPVSECAGFEAAAPGTGH